MSSPIAPDLADHDPDLARLLADRAGTIEPRGTTPAHLARRASRIRHRRRATVAGVGLAASAIVASIVVTRPTSDDGQQVETGVAAPGTDAPVEDPAATLAPGALVVRPLPTPEIPHTPSGPPLRLGLDLAGAQVGSVGDFPNADEPVSPLLPGVSVDLTGADPARKLAVMASFGGDQQLITTGWGPNDTAVEPVDLGDGRSGTIIRMPTLDRSSTMVQLAFEIDATQLNVYGTGLSDDELVAVARGLQATDEPALVVSWYPEDLVQSEIRNLDGGAGMRSAIFYTLPDGLSVSVGVSSQGGSLFADDLERIRSAPSATELVRTVRGNEAIVRRNPSMTSVIWREPTGHLVEIYIGTTAGMDPTIVPDENPVVDAVVQLDEATFLELLAAHPIS